MEKGEDTSSFVELLFDNFGESGIEVYWRFLMGESPEEIMLAMRLSEAQTFRIIEFIKNMKGDVGGLFYGEKKPWVKKYKGEDVFLEIKEEKVGIREDAEVIHEARMEDMKNELLVYGRFGSNGLKAWAMLLAGRNLGEVIANTGMSALEIGRMIEYLVSPKIEIEESKEQMGETETEKKEMVEDESLYTSKTLVTAIRPGVAPFSLRDSYDMPLFDRSRVRGTDIFKLQILIIVGVILLLILIYFYFKPLVSPTSVVVEPRLTMSSDKDRYLFNESVRIFGSAINCGNNVSIYVSGNFLDEVAVEDGHYSKSMQGLSPGQHEITAKCGNTTTTLSILVFEPECSEGVVAPCIDSLGCSGTRTCRNGRWTACYVRRICTPGEEVGCMMPDGCSFGKKVCNECGTDFGPCRRV
ncbi:MAG: hypothetical protein QXP42_00710 [Candidatus Micrarchaeia archaeon]